jgi:hypothetical protein
VEPRATHVQWQPTKAALVRDLNAPQGLDAPGGTVAQSPTTPLASGAINQSGDVLSVELVEPNEHPSVIMIRWPDHATVVQPARFNAVAAEIMRLLASAVTAYNQHKARRL